MSSERTMREIENSVRKFKPSPNSRKIEIPLTFNRTTESKYNSKNALFITLLTVFFTIIFTIVIIRARWMFITKLILLGLLYFGFVAIINYIVLRGTEKRNSYLEILEEDFQIPLSALWGILDTSSEYPYISHFTNRTRGVFVKFNKDVKEGKNDNASFYHYNAISEFLRLAHEENVTPIHIDYMENIGEDTRINDVKENISKMSNVDYQNLMSNIVSNLERITSKRFSTFDVYLFVTNDPSADLEYKIKRISNKMLDANYKKFIVLDKEGIRKLTETVFNLESFSANKAKEDLVKEDINASVRIIKINNEDGTESIYNKTRKQMREELAEAKKNKSKEKANKVKNAPKRTKNVKLDDKVQVFDIEDNTSFLQDNEQKERGTQQNTEVEELKDKDDIDIF